MKIDYEKASEYVKKYERKECGFCPKCGKGINKYSGSHNETLTEYCHNCGDELNWSTNK